MSIEKAREEYLVVINPDDLTLDEEKQTSLEKTCNCKNGLEVCQTSVRLADHLFQSLLNRGFRQMESNIVPEPSKQKEKLETMMEDYALEKVPMESRRPWLDLAAVQVGVVSSLAILLVGGTVTFWLVLDGTFSHCLIVCGQYFFPNLHGLYRL